MTLAQPGFALFRYSAKMAAVEYEKCASIHISRFDRFEYTIRVLSVHFFSPRFKLERQTQKYSKCGYYGYWNTALFYLNIIYLILLKSPVGRI